MVEDNKDIRWIQRFSNYNKSFKQLERFIGKEKLNEMEEQGLIKSFEYTYELSWKTLQDLLKEKGYNNILGPKPVIEQCFHDGYIQDGKSRMRMHTSRYLTSHTYDEEIVKEIVNDIRTTYFGLLENLQIRLFKEKEVSNREK